MGLTAQDIAKVHSIFIFGYYFITRTWTHEGKDSGTEMGRRQTETGSQTDRKIDKQRQSNRQREKQTETEKQRQRQKTETETETDRHTYRDRDQEQAEKKKGKKRTSRVNQSHDFSPRF